MAPPGTRRPRTPQAVRPPALPDVARACWGAACLLAPALVGRSLVGGAPDERALRVVRVLGARHLVQAAGTRLLPPRLALGGGAAVDALHAVTAVLLGLGDAPRRRSALVDAAAAAAWSAWGVRRYRRLP